MYYLIMFLSMFLILLCVLHVSNVYTIVYTLHYCVYFTLFCVLQYSEYYTNLNTCSIRISLAVAHFLGYDMLKCFPANCEISEISINIRNVVLIK